MCRQKAGGGEGEGPRGEADVNLHHPRSHLTLCMVQGSGLYLTKGRRKGEEMIWLVLQEVTYEGGRLCMTSTGVAIRAWHRRGNSQELSRITLPSCPSNQTVSCRCGIKVERC